MPLLQGGTSSIPLFFIDLTKIRDDYVLSYSNREFKISNFVYPIGSIDSWHTLIIPFLWKMLRFV